MGKYKGRFKALNIKEADRRAQWNSIFDQYKGRRVELFLSDFSRARGDIGEGGVYARYFISAEVYNPISFKWEPKTEPLEIRLKTVMEMKFI